MTPLISYGDRWRTQRKLWHTHLGPQAISNYHSRLGRITLEFVKTLHDNSSKPEQDVCGTLTESVRT